jgi:F420-dependent oxidoreductase-like protein
MRLGLQINAFKWPGGDAKIGPTFAEIVREAEDAGFYSAWVMDHFYQGIFLGPENDPMLEAYSALSYAAGVTSRIKLGAMVTGVTYRYPGILVKQVTTLDVLSGGRAYFSIGAAWYEREHLDLGAPFPPVAERFERVEETLQIALQMWSGEVKPFNGKHYQLPEPMCRPLPVSKPHPPILVGGSGERKTLRFVARYGDACNLFDTPDLPRKLEVLKEHCETEGRAYSDIEKTVLINLNVNDHGSDTAALVDFVAGRVSDFAELGIDQLIIAIPTVSEPGTLDVFGERIIPEMSGIAVAGR